MNVLTFVVLLIISIAIYFLPTMLSSNVKDNKISNGIFTLNLLFGWTIIGWIWALVWAFKAEKRLNIDLL